MPSRLERAERRIWLTEHIFLMGLSSLVVCFLDKILEWIIKWMMFPQYCEIEVLFSRDKEFFNYAKIWIG